MPANTKLIKTRIKSVKNTKKVTKAMELVAAAKMRKSVEYALETREYAQLAWRTALRLSTSRTIASSDYLHKFFRDPSEENNITLIVFASNRGLCGAFNSNITKSVAKFIKEKGTGKVEVIVIGKKLVSSLSVFGVKTKMAFDKDDSTRKVEPIINVSNMVYEDFKSGKTDSVYVAYTDYESSLVQTPVIRALFPFQAEESITAGLDEDVIKQGLDYKSFGYIYEPSKRKVLSYLVPRLGRLQIFQAMLESNASEHSARMVAMKSATDAAGEMLEDLTLQFNRARQAAITQEIAEISAGMAAVT